MRPDVGQEAAYESVEDPARLFTQVRRRGILGSWTSALQSSKKFAKNGALQQPAVKLVQSTTSNRCLASSSDQVSHPPR